MSTRRIAMLVASTRNGSLNRRLARAIEKEAPDTLSFDQIPMDAMPFYNGDLESDRPPAVDIFTTAIRSADAVCIVTPEYNRSIPAVLKNAIDWGSKPPKENVWKDRIVAMTGTSPGAIGTAVGQQHLRQILSILGAHVMPAETYISFKSPDLIDETGIVSDEATRSFIASFAERLEAYVNRLT